MINRRIFFLTILLSIIHVGAAEDKYAFVTIYYPNGKLSPSDFVGIRTMYRSFKSINSKAEFLVLTLEETPKAEIRILENDGMKVSTIQVINAYTQHSVAADYQKYMHLAALWDLTQYKRVAFVDYYTIFVHNFDSIFDCAYLCVKDEQPLVCDDVPCSL